MGVVAFPTTLNHLISIRQLNISTRGMVTKNLKRQFLSQGDSAKGPHGSAKGFEGDMRPATNPHSKGTPQHPAQGVSVASAPSSHGPPRVRNKPTP